MTANARVVLLALAALVSGCAGGLTSTLAPAPAASFVGARTPAVALADVDAALGQLQSELERRLVGRDWGVPLQLSRGAEAFLRVRLGADESFEAGSAQLQATRLQLYAEIAEVLRSAPGTVVHVLVHGDAAPSDPATDISARRAASLVNYFVTRGVAATRVRGEGRGAREPATAEPDAAAVNRRVELVLKPVIAGHEAEAWMPPPPVACAPCTGHE